MFLKLVRRGRGVEHVFEMVISEKGVVLDRLGKLFVDENFYITYSFKKLMFWSKSGVKLRGKLVRVLRDLYGND